MGESVNQTVTTGSAGLAYLVFGACVGLIGWALLDLSPKVAVGVGAIAAIGLPIGLAGSIFGIAFLIATVQHYRLLD